MLDSLDRKICEALVASPEATLAEVAEKVGSTTTPVWRRMNRLKAAGILAPRYEFNDPDKAGVFDIGAFKKELAGVLKKHNAFIEFQYSTMSEYIYDPRMMVVAVGGGREKEFKLGDGHTLAFWRLQE